MACLEELGESLALFAKRSLKERKVKVCVFAKDTFHYFGAQGVRLGRLFGDFSIRGCTKQEDCENCSLHFRGNVL